MTNEGGLDMENWQKRQGRIRKHMNQFRPISEKLQRQGYETTALTANPWTTRDTGFNIGFDNFCEISSNSGKVSSNHLSKSIIFRIADAGLKSLPGDPFGWSWKKEWFSQWTGYFELISERLSMLSEPFFLWIFILDTHQPYVSPRKFREEGSFWETYYSLIRYWRGEISDEALPKHARKMISRTYRDSVRSVDHFLSSLVEEVQEFDPILLFSSDHGEALGEHGNYGHDQALYEENLHVPFFIHNLEKSMTIEEQLPMQRLIDIINDLSQGVEFDPDSYTEFFTISKTENNESRSVRTNEWKLITGDSKELYNLKTDPVESENVLDSHQKVADNLNQILERHKRTQCEKEAIIEATNEIIDGNDF
jgi:arylsulfatase A-like enzyme